jgi:hypothetical protein
MKERLIKQEDDAVGDDERSVQMRKIAEYVV